MKLRKGLIWAHYNISGSGSRVKEIEIEKLKREGEREWNKMLAITKCFLYMESAKIGIC